MRRRSRNITRRSSDYRARARLPPPPPLLLPVAVAVVLVVPPPPPPLPFAVEASAPATAAGHGTGTFDAAWRRGEGRQRRLRLPSSLSDISCSGRAFSVARSVAVGRRQIISRDNSARVRFVVDVLRRLVGRPVSHAVSQVFSTIIIRTRSQ